MIDSPAILLLKQIIQFDKSYPQPLYVQAAQQIINAIQRGYLSKGTALPGTRILGKSLKINRNTVVAIYDELASQGWVEIIPNKGTFILETKRRHGIPTTISVDKYQKYDYSDKTNFPFQKSFHLSSTEEFTQARYRINDGRPDLRLHPIHQFTRWYSASMKRKSLADKWDSNDLGSISLFRMQLCNHLNLTRAFNIKTENVLNTRSTEMSLYIIAQLLIQNNDIVIVGSLSNYATNMIFQEVGARIITIPVDENGMDIEYLQDHYKPNQIRCVYLSPQRDYPTTVSLSAERKLMLLQLADSYNFAIIEDDYDYDFQYDGYATTPLASSDAKGSVIYLGKLGQSLIPSFQSGFIVAPKNFIAEAKNYLQLLDHQGDFIQEQLLTELIYEGEIYRYIKKNSMIYRKRRDHLIELLEQYFKDIAQWIIPNGGLAIWLRFEPMISLIQFAKQAEMLDVFLPKTILYQNTKTCAIRFGFGHLNEEELSIIIPKLKQAYDRLDL